MKRLFIAVPIQDRTRNEIVKGIFGVDAIRKMPVRWTPFQNLHLTLQFLGDVEEKRIPDLKQIMNALPQPDRPEKLVFTSIGAFPGPASPKIIWLGLEKNEYLLRMQRSLSFALSENDFPFDRKSFKPHLTLGRVRENAGFTPAGLAFMEELAGNVKISDSSLDRVTLFESILRPGGPLYTVLFEKKLNG